MHHRKIGLNDVVDRIRQTARRSERLIVEGSGGLLVPLGEGYTVADLIGRLQCPVAVVARNRLGTINHTLLTVGALRKMGVNRLQVVLMNRARSDSFSHSNERVLRQILAPVRLFSVPFMGPGAVRVGALKRNYKKVKITLARMTDAGSF